MRIVRDFNFCPSASQGAVVALGNFDGVHRGHQEILGQCIAAARAYKVPAAVMSFEPHPREFFSRTRECLRLCSFRRKIALIEELGIDTLFLVRFNRSFSSLAAASFIEKILHKQLAVKHVVTGYNFAFGKDRAGTTDYLETRAHEFSFGFTACPPVLDGQGNVISSSAIRRLLGHGEVNKAASLLGRPYDIEGRVRHGQQRGRLLGFPTANVSLRTLFKPRFGVYAARAWVDNVPYDAIANIGIKPTVGGEQPLLEVHLFNTSQDLYGKLIRVDCIDFIREERKFDSLDLLKAQIAMDCVKAKEVLHARA